jgi:hypothetical protein
MYKVYRNSGEQATTNEVTAKKVAQALIRITSRKRCQVRFGSQKKVAATASAW